MLHQRLQHVDVAFGSDPAVDSRMNRFPYEKRRIHRVRVDGWIEPARFELLGLMSSGDTYNVSDILKPFVRIHPLNRVAVFASHCHLFRRRPTFSTAAESDLFAREFPVRTRLPNGRLLDCSREHSRLPR